MSETEQRLRRQKEQLRAEVKRLQEQAVKLQAERDDLVRWRHARTIRVSGGRDAIWHEAWSQTPGDAPAWWHWADEPCEEYGFLAANPLPKEETQG